jgi:hypothetical protein
VRRGSASQLIGREGYDGNASKSWVVRQLEQQSQKRSLPGPFHVSMLIVDGSSSNATEIVPVKVLEIAKSIAISRWTSSCFDIDGR